MHAELLAGRSFGACFGGLGCRARAKFLTRLTALSSLADGRKFWEAAPVRSHNKRTQVAARQHRAPRSSSAATRRTRVVESGERMTLTNA